MTDEHAMKVAKVIAKAMGDNFSDAFKNKQRWTAKRGMSGGRFRDVNEPFQDDYIAAAQAAAAVIAADRAGLVAEIERLRDGLAGAIAAISDPRGLDDAICCSGHMCGCRGSSHRELLLHDLSEVLARTALGASHDAEA